MGAAALLCGCGKTDDPVEYNSFEFKPDEYHGTWRTFTYIKFTDGYDSTGREKWAGSNVVSSATDVLNHAANYGWRLAWTDGRNFIVERPLSRGGDFVVEGGVLETHP